MTARTDSRKPFPKIKRNLRVRRQKAMVLAHQIVRHTGFDFGYAQKLAWAYIKRTPLTWLVKFTKTNGETVNRVVHWNWRDYYTPKGTGRPTKPGQILYADASKKLLGASNPTGSTYHDRIIKSY